MYRIFVKVKSCLSPNRVINVNTTVVIPKRWKVLTVDNVNPNVKLMEYAVRGPIVIRAGEIERELRKGEKKPFVNVTRANIGDCHAVGQKPITFIRQILALCSFPKLLDDPSFPLDVKDRARKILDDCISLGCYSESVGVGLIRRETANYIAERDGHPSRAEDIFLSNGASECIKVIMKLMMTGEQGSRRTGIMIPTPQYPLYSATIAEFNAVGVNYHLDEATDWSLDIDDLKRAIEDSRSRCIPKGIVIINPGNPTGQVLTRKNIEDVIKFAKRENLFILADEVYQHNIYAHDREFHSFKKVLNELGDEYKDQELASFMSVSKGYMGECGLRGGYCEVINMDEDVKVQMLKSISASLCSSLHGQVAMAAVVNPPKPDEPSHDLYMQERTKVLSDLKYKAELVASVINSIDGMTCSHLQGAMYAFPSLDLPAEAIRTARSRGVAPDSLYCFELLEKTGICVVPGSGFGQMEGTHHFRMTILPPVDQLQSMMDRIRDFHADFVKRYSRQNSARC